MGQSFNAPGIKSFLNVAFRHQYKNLLIPHYEIKDINAIDFKRLKEIGIKGIIFDKDNTLTHPYADDIAPSIVDSVKECQEVFHNRMVILSNSAGSQDDKGNRNASRIEKNLHIPVLIHKEKKPEGLQDVMKYFGESIEPHELAVVGDRYLTDIVFGNQHGMLTFRCDIFTTIGDNWIAAHARTLERWMCASNRAQGLSPPIHRLISELTCSGQSILKSC